MIKIGKKIDEKGIEQFVFDETLPDGYEDITSVSNFVNVGEFLFRDYKWVRKRLQEQSVNWETLNEIDKISVCRYKATTEQRCKEVLANTYDYWMTKFDLQSQECRSVRFSMAKTILLKNVSVPDRYSILGFLNTTPLIDNYVTYGIEGTTEGDPTAGLFNWIESTGIFALSGLASINLTMIGDQTKAQMIVSMMQYLREGFTES